MTHFLIELEAEFDAGVRALQPYDASVWLGYPASGLTGFTDPAELRGALAGMGITRALVSHTMAALHSTWQGNEALLAALPLLEGCHGIATLLPDGGGDPDGGSRNLERFLQHGIRAVRLFPKDHRYALSVPGMPLLLEALQSHGLPLFIQIGQTSWGEISKIANSFPRLAVMVEGIGHHEFLNIRGCLPWLKETPNLLVTTQNQFLCGGLELIVKTIGEERVFFSSNFPVDDPAAGLSLLLLSQLSEAARQSIAHGNLEKLVARVGKGGYFA